MGKLDPSTRPMVPYAPLRRQQDAKCKRGRSDLEENRTTGPAEGGITKTYPQHRLIKLWAGGNGG